MTLKKYLVLCLLSSLMVAAAIIAIELKPTAVERLPTPSVITSIPSPRAPSEPISPYATPGSQQ